MRLTLLDELVGDPVDPSLGALAVLARVGRLGRAARELAEGEVLDDLWSVAQVGEAQPLVRLAADSGGSAPHRCVLSIPGVAGSEIVVRLDPTGAAGWVAQVSRTPAEAGAALRVTIRGAQDEHPIELAPTDVSHESWVAFDLGASPSVVVARLDEG